MKLRKSRDSAREPIGARQIAKRRPLRRRQSADETLAVDDPPKPGNQFRHHTLAHVWFRTHGRMLVIRNYLDKAVFPKYSCVSLLNSYVRAPRKGEGTPMQISNNAYMGVEVLVHLAAYETDRPCTAQALAEWINRPMTYTETLMSRLRAAGLVRARRGSGGGYYLNKPGDMITVAEIFKALDEPRVLTRRPLNAISLEPETFENLRGTDLLWEVLKSRILLFLSGVSLTDIATEMAHPFADDETDSSPAFEASMQSTARH